MRPAVIKSYDDRHVQLSNEHALEAREIVRQHFPPSRLRRADAISSTIGADIFLKLESELPTGSFKVRGALYALAVNMKRRHVEEVVASSTGNHGAAVAYAARQFGVNATIFLPRSPNPVKREKIAALGARIVEHGADLAEAFEGAAEYSRTHRAFFLNDATDPDLPAGPGTIADEILDDLAQVDAIYVAVGDTALIRGLGARAKALRPGVRIIGVQAEQAPAYFLSWRAGRVVSTDTANTIADGLATRTPAPDNVEAIGQLVDDMRLVTEDEMIAAVRLLLTEEHVVAEPAGAAPLAALLKEKTYPARRRTVVLVVSGSNLAPNTLGRVAAP
jgi:threonine dehydratase